MRPKHGQLAATPRSSTRPPAPPSRRLVRTALPFVAAAALVGGFADLAMGGTSGAAAMLLLAYCAVVPAAILAGRLTGRD
jgi:hypothetical protein